MCAYAERTPVAADGALRFVDEDACARIVRGELAFPGLDVVEE